MKPTTNRLLCIGRVLIILTGFLLVSWDAEAADIPNSKQFFKGCSVTSGASERTFDRISGICLGHSFEQNHDKDCYVQRYAIMKNLAQWKVSGVGSCIVHGKRRFDSR
jgi:hypothetical protein